MTFTIAELTAGGLDWVQWYYIGILFLAFASGLIENNFRKIVLIVLIQLPYGGRILGWW